MDSTPPKPDWKKGDVLVLIVLGCGRQVFISEHDPFWDNGAWRYGCAPETDFRLALVEDVQWKLKHAADDVRRGLLEIERLTGLLNLIREPEHASA